MASGYNENSRPARITRKDSGTGHLGTRTGATTWLSALDALQTPIFVHDADHRILEANRAYCERAGLPPHRIVGRPYWEVFPLGDGPLPSCRAGVERARHPESDGVGSDTGEALDTVTLDNGQTYLSRAFVIPDEHGEYGHSVHIVEEITERLRAERARSAGECALREREEQLQQVFLSMTEGVLVVDDAGSVQYANPAVAELFARSAEALRGEALGLPIGGPDAQEIELHPARGLPRTVEMRVRPIHWGGNQAHLVNLRDITERKRVESELRRAAIVFEEAREGILVTDADQRIVAVNPAFTEMTGYPESEVLDRTPRILRSGLHDEAFYQSMWQSLHERGFWTGEVWNRCRDGTTFASLANIRAVVDGDGRITHYLSVLADISRIKEYQSQLERILHSDPLTGLPNRLLFHDRLEQALLATVQHTGLLAVLSLDLNDLKTINFSLGHHVGDAILQQFGQRLSRTLRPEDTVARLGGDEFGILMPGVSDANEVTTILEQLRHEFDQPFRIGDRGIPMSASIGVSLFPQQQGEAGELFQQANAAMHEAKREGVAYRFFSEELTAQARERVQLGSDLREALKENALTVHFQPQVDLERRTWIGCEALIRWHHPCQGWIPPDRFIPVAERIGLIIPLGDWVLEQACQQGRAWLDAGYEIGRIGVNFAAPEIAAPDLEAKILAILARTGLPAERLEVEITESLLVDPDAVVVERLQRLRRHGITVAIDDFGTGYSALSYLRDLPVDRLKIDRSFIDPLPLPEDERVRTITGAIVHLGANLGFDVIAEGIETAAQSRTLRAMGCQQGQGYHYARPAPADRLAPPRIGR